MTAHSYDFDHLRTMARPFRSQKRQTRLQFENLPSASGAKEEYSQSVQGRLASVRYSGAKSRRATPESRETNSLPTPEPSSAMRARTSSPLSSPPSSPELPQQHTPRQPTTSHSDDDDEDDIPLPSSKRRKLATAVNKASIASSPRRSTRLGASSPLQSATVTRRSRSSPANAATAWSDLGSAETSGDDADEIITKPTVRRRSKPATQKDDPFVVKDDEVQYISSDDGVPVKPARRAHRNDVDDFMVDDDEIEYESINDSDRAVSSTQKQRRLRNKKSKQRSREEQEELEEDLLDLQDSNNEEDDHRSRTRGGPVTTKRDETKAHLARLKKQRAGKRAPRIIDSEDEEDDEENESMSGTDGIDISYITQSPSTTNHRHKSYRNSQSPSLIGAPEPHPERFDDDAHDDDFIVEDTDPTTSSRHNRPNPDIPLQFTSFASAKPKELFIHIIEWMVKNKISPAFSRDDDLYDLSFNRVDDQVKAQAGSRLISAAWNAKFKHAILARPVVTIDALPGLDEDNIRTCDACNRTNHPARYDFKFTGTPYHKDTLEPLDADADEEDDSNHDSVTDDKNNLTSDTASPKSADIDTQSHHSNRTYDSQGHLLPLQSQHFYLGRYCAAAAEMGHKLTHWKHHLNTNVLTYLAGQGVLSADEIIRRDKKSHKKREKEAETIVDAMQDTGVIRELWDGFQADLDDARYGMEGHEGGRSGKGRGKQRIGSVRAWGAD